MDDDQDGRSADGSRSGAIGGASLADLQAWTGAIGQMQQLMLEQMSQAANAAAAVGAGIAPAAGDSPAMFVDPARFADAQADLWKDSIDLWQRFLNPAAADGGASPLVAQADRDRRFAAAQWRDNPMFDMIRQSYLLIADHLLRGIEAVDGIDERQREQLRFATRAATDALSPANFALTNPLVIEKAIETRGANLVKGLEHMLADLAKGQLTHTDAQAFEIGRNIAATPGKVIHETPLYQLIQYSPTTEKVLATPLVIFPPWINRFYILDLNPEKSFIRWAVEQGLTVFMVSWKSADESMAEVTMDDYVLNGQLDAIDVVRDLLDVQGVHAIGYCVAGTNLAASLAYLAATDAADKVKSATFFTAQVDFENAGDLNLFIDPQQLDLLDSLGGTKGYLDGRYMAMTFNLLRGRDLIWSYVVNNYLLGQDYPVFDLLHWNADTTNLPSKWHRAYLEDLYRDNKLVKPGAISIGGVPIDLSSVVTPSYVQAGREDHIAPAESVWKLSRHFAGPLRFVLAGSGHIAGVVNPPSADKYQYWTNPAKVATLDAFIAGARETRGSWWPDWIDWVRAIDPRTVPAKAARKPGRGRLPAIEDAPGRYVRTR